MENAGSLHLGLRTIALELFNKNINPNNKTKVKTEIFIDLFVFVSILFKTNCAVWARINGNINFFN